MAHSNGPEKIYLAKILQIAPDLDIREIRINSDGMANDVVFVNEEVVFRFAKGEFGHASLTRELKVLESLNGQVNLAIPDPFYRAEDAIAYQFLPGSALTRDQLGKLGSAERKKVAGQLGGFLQSMHAIDDPALPPTAAPVKAEAFRAQRERARERVYPLLLPHQVAWVEQMYAFIDQPDAFNYTSGLVHGDLAPYHLLFDLSLRRLSGVIDFGVSGLGDPAGDLGALLQYYGPIFVQQMADDYPEVEFYLPRARFYAQAIEIQWVLLGLEGGETFWYTAHLGGWRGLD